MKPKFFKSPEDFRVWLARHHGTGSELLLGFYTTKSGKGGITHPEALDEALCHGWIDGVGKNLDANSYTIRFSPRKARSHWSQINIKRAHELKARGLMHPAGIAAFEKRDESRTINYSYELKAAELGPALEKQFKANRKAWEFFQTQPPSYQRHVKFYVTSAKKEETRARRLAILIADSARGRRIGILQSPKDKK